MTSVEIPSSELIHFKEQVKKWLTIGPTNYRT